MEARMALPQNRPKRGDLIDVDLINQILDALEAHGVRLDALENLSGSKPVIMAVRPSRVRAGDQLEVLGNFFADPASDNTVTVGTNLIQRFEAGLSDENKLVFGLPFIQVTGEEESMLVTVRTKYGFDSITVTVLPARSIPAGVVTFAPDAANSAIVPRPGTISTWIFTMTSETDIGESYEVDVVFTDVQGSLTRQQLQDSATLLNQSDTVLPRTPIRFERFTPTIIKVRIPIPDTATPSTTRFKMALRATSVNNDTGLSRTADPTQVIVGAATVGSHPNVTFDLSPIPETPEPGSANKIRKVSVNEGGSQVEYIEVPFNGLGSFNLRAVFNAPEASNYQHAITFSPAGGGAWEDPVQFSPRESIGKTPGEFTPIGVVLRLRAAANAAHTETRTLRFTTIKQASGNSGQTESWTEIKIRGYTPSA
jgi:hypothetical protein